MVKQIPNIFTLLNLIFGCIAIVCIMQNGITIQYNADGGQLIDITERLWLGSMFIGLAAVVDFFDGFVARLLGATSKLGAELDSLSDVVSFGVAPSMILFQFLRMSYAKSEDGIDISLLALIPAFILAAAAAYRLAKFNIDDSQSYSFKGVPTPAVGLVVASIPLIYWNTINPTVINLLLNNWFLYAVILLLSWLMISNIPIMALKFKSYDIKSNMPKLILLVIAILSILLFHWLAVPIIFIAYIILSLVIKN